MLSAETKKIHEKIKKSWTSAKKFRIILSWRPRWSPPPERVFMSFFKVDTEAIKATKINESTAIAAEMMFQEIKEEADRIAIKWIRTYYTRRRKGSGNYLIARSPFNKNIPVVTIKHGLQWLLCEMHPELNGNEENKAILKDIISYLRHSKGERTAEMPIAIKNHKNATYQIDFNL